MAEAPSVSCCHKPGGRDSAVLWKNPVVDVQAQQQLLNTALWVKSLELRPNDDSPGHDLIMLLASEPEQPASVACTAQLVQGLTISMGGGGHYQLGWLRVRDVADRQWDRVRVRVEDVEEGRLAFSCLALSVEQILGGVPA
ncbi:MAG: hypothetical protein R3F05_19355 [Planctomycetota bacterium]